MTAVHALLAAWLVLYAGVRSTRMAGCFNVDNPDLPEISHERTQMALARVGSPDSVPLALPCMEQAWKQQTRHRQQLTGIACTTVALLTPQLGCSHIHAEVGEDRYTLQATHSFQRSDLGVPAWEVPVRLASLPG